MTILGIIALIALVILGIIVLRVKSDPLEKESVREFLAEAKRAGDTPPSEISGEAASLKDQRHRSRDIEIFP